MRRSEFPPDLTRGVLSQDAPFDLLTGAEQIASAKEQTEVGIAFLKVPTNTLTHNLRSPVAQGFSQLSCQNDGGDYPYTRPTLYYKVANVLIQSPDFLLNTTIMVVKYWRRHTLGR